MKKIVCFLISMLILTVNVFAEKSSEYIEPQHVKLCIMNVGENKITSGFETFETKYSCYEENGVLMIPLNTLFTFAGFETHMDSENKKFSVRIGNSELYVNGMERKSITCGENECKMLVPAIFTDDECFVSFNDAMLFVDYDSVNKCLFMRVNSDFEDTLKNQFEYQSRRSILSVIDGEKRIFKDSTPIKLDTEIYNNSGSIMLPARAVFEAVFPDTEFMWDNESKRAKMYFEDKVIEFDCISQKIYIDSNEVYYAEYNFELKDGRLFVPLRILKAVKGLSDYDIYWSNSFKTAYIRI